MAGKCRQFSLSWNWQNLGTWLTAPLHIKTNTSPKIRALDLASGIIVQRSNNESGQINYEMLGLYKILKDGYGSSGILQKQNKLGSKLLLTSSQRRAIYNIMGVRRMLREDEPQLTIMTWAWQICCVKCIGSSNEFTRREIFSASSSESGRKYKKMNIKLRGSPRHNKIWWNYLLRGK